MRGRTYSVRYLPYVNKWEATSDDDKIGEYDLFEQAMLELLSYYNRLEQERYPASYER